jgi:hypothetical protein
MFRGGVELAASAMVRLFYLKTIGYVINFGTDRQRRDPSKKVEPTNGEFLKAIQSNNPKMWPENFSGV